MFDVISVGSNTVDVFVKTDAEIVKEHTKHGDEELIAYRAGSKILINQIDFFTGGGGTNTSVGFSRLGLKTGYLGKIGNDDNGLKIFKELQKEKVHFIGNMGEHSGYSVVLDSMHDDRTILTYKGSNNDLKFSELNHHQLKTKWFYFSSMMGESFKTIEHLARMARLDGIKVAFNPSAYQVKEKETLKNILLHTDVLIFNKEEARIFLGTEVVIDDMLKKIREHGPKIVVITNGKKGVYVYDGSFFWHTNPLKNLKIVETTGAGDAFSTGFVAGIIMKKNIEDCVRMGMINSESVICAYGAKNILLNKKQMMDRLKKDYKKRKVFMHKI